MEENETTELKSSLDEEKVIQAMVSFANQKGGRIYIGITDSGKPVGLLLGKQKLELFTRKVHDEVQPAIVFDTSYEDNEGKMVLIISVQEAKRKPVFYRGVAYKRINKTTLRVTDPEEIRNLFIHKTIFFDEIDCDSATMDDIDHQTVEKFVRMMQASGRLVPASATPIEILKKLNLVEGKHLKNGAIMLFGKEPKKFFPVWGIRCAVFSSTNDFTALEDEEGNLFDAIEKTMSFMLSNLKKEIKMIGLRRTEKTIIPQEVLREALVNAVTHRDYFFPSYTYVAIHPTHVEIRNPGKLEGLSIKELATTHPSVIKNPHLAQAIYLAGYIERWGSGTLKMINGMRENALKDPDFNVDTMFIVRLSLERQEFNEREKFVINIFESGKTMTPTILAKKYGVSLTTAVKDFKHLMTLGLIRKTGVGRGGRYSFTKPN